MAAADSSSSPDNDLVVGAAPGTSLSSPDNDFTIGLQQQQQQQADAARSYLSRSWTTLYNQANPPPKPSATPIQDVTKDVTGSFSRGVVGTAGTMATDPSYAITRPLFTAGTAAYDWLAPKLGLPQSTSAFRDLINEPDIATSQLSRIPGPNPMTAAPTTSVGQQLDMPIQSGVGALMMGPGGAIRRTTLGLAGGGAGQAVGDMTDQRYAPLAAMVTNALVQGGGQAALPNPGASIDAANAATAQRSQAMFGIPFRAPDLVPNSVLRSPGHVQDLNDALRGNIVTLMGQNPDTGLTETTNKVTPAVVDTTLRNAGQTIENIGNNNSIPQPQASALDARLAQIQNSIPRVLGLQPGDPAVLRQAIADARNAIGPNVGMPGSSYLDLTRTNSALDNIAGDRNTGVANIGLQALDALHDAMAQNLSPQDRAALTAARFQYRVAKTVQPLTAADRTGNIDAGDFSNRVTEQSNLLDTGQRNIGRSGGGTLGALADAANLISQGAQPKSLSPIPSMLSPSAALPFFLGRPIWQTAAAALAPPAMQAIPATIMRSAPYARQAIQNARFPPSALQQGLLGAATGAAFPPP